MRYPNQKTCKEGIWWYSHSTSSPTKFPFTIHQSVGADYGVTDNFRPSQKFIRTTAPNNSGQTAFSLTVLSMAAW